MADTAAQLVDFVVPHVPIRQWVLSMPRPLRFLLAKDARLITKAANIFVSEIFRHQRRLAGLPRLKDAESGAVTGVQRFGGAVNLNIHLHTLVLDGVYPKEGAISFKRLREPGPGERMDILVRTRDRIVRMLRKKGYAVESEEAPGEDDPSIQDVIQAASIREWIGLSSDPRRVTLLGLDEDEVAEAMEKPCRARTKDGWNLHAGVRIRAGDRKGLEQLARYVLRPPFSTDRLTELPDGRIAYEFRRPRVGGSTHVILTPVELLEKLAALVPPPRAHLVRYHGILAPHAAKRKVVVPKRPQGAEEEACGREPVSTDAEDKPKSRRPGRKSRTPWADLMRRTMGLEVLTCPKCLGLMEPIACIKKRETIAKILRAMGLPDEVPELAPARPPPQLRFQFVQDREAELP